MILRGSTEKDFNWLFSLKKKPHFLVTAQKNYFALLTETITINNLMAQPLQQRNIIINSNTMLYGQVHA